MQTIEYFIQHKELLKQIINNVGTPVFVTDKSILEQKVKNIKNSFSKNCLLYYAVKANFNPSIIKVLQESGINGIEAISDYEIKLARKLGFQSNQILFTGNNTSRQELEIAKESGVMINIGSLSELKYFCNKYKGSEVFIRINPGFGDGEFKKVITGGENSKFGILHTQVSEALEIISKNGIKILGIHCHLGSGIYYTDKFAHMIEYMFSLASKISSIKFIDIGGGFGVRYRPSEKEIDLAKFATVVYRYYQKYNIDAKIIIEPGKYLVAESTFLLTKVTNIRKGQDIKMVCVNTGFNHIIRPAFYSSYHHIINISKLQNKKEYVKVVGNICESTDILSEKVALEKPEENDVLAILTAGAYCSSMSNLYNLRPYASEVLIDKEKFVVIREALSFEKTMSSLGFIT